MKQAKFIIPFAAAILLAGCSAGGQTSSSSNNSSAESSSVIPVESSESDFSSESREEPEPKEITIADLAEYADTFKTNAGKISGGTITKLSPACYDFEDDETTVATFVYGSDSNGDTSKISVATDGGDAEDTFLMKNVLGDVLTMKKSSNGGYELAGIYDTYDEIGPKFEDFIESNTAYGVENFFDEIIDMAKENINNDFAAFNDGQNVYFSFGYYEDIDYTVYDVTGKFPEGATSLADLSVNIYEYSSSDTYTINEATGTFEIASDAKADGKDFYTIKQTVGARTYTNDVDTSVYNHATLSLSDEFGEDVTSETTLEMEMGEDMIITIDSTPDSANLNIDPLSMKVVSGDEDGVTGTFDRDWFGVESLKLTAEAVGDYTIEISNAANTSTASFKVSVTAVAIESITLRHYTEDLNDDYNTDLPTKGSTINTYVDVVNYFTVNPTPSNATLNIEATLTDADGNEIDEDNEDVILDTEDSIYGGDFDAISFISSEAGDYTLTVASADDPTIKETLKIHVAEDTFAGIVSETYGWVSGGTSRNTVSFTPSEGDSGVGTLVYESGDETKEASYQIRKVEDEDYYYFDCGEDSTLGFTLYIGYDYNLYRQDEEDGVFFLIHDTSSLGYTLCQDWAGTDTDDYGYSISLTFQDNYWASGSIYDEDDGEWYLECEFMAIPDEYAEGYYEIKFVDAGYDPSMVENEWFGDDDEQYLPATASWDVEGKEITLHAGWLDTDFRLFPSLD